MANTHAFPDTLYEVQAICGDTLSPGIISNTWPAAPGTGMTLAAFATRGYVLDGAIPSAPRLIYVAQDNRAVTLTGSAGTYWIALHMDTFSAVSGWTRVPGSHYLWAFGATRPEDPNGGLVAFSCTVTGSNITAVNPAAAAAVHNRVAYFDPVGHMAHEPLFLYDEGQHRLVVGKAAFSSDIHLDVAGHARAMTWQADEAAGDGLLAFSTNISAGGPAGTNVNRYAFISSGSAPSFLQGTLQVNGPVGIGGPPSGTFHMLDVSGRARSFAWVVNDYSGDNVFAFSTDLDADGGSDRFAIRTLGTAPSRFAGPVFFDGLQTGVGFHVEDHPGNTPAFSTLLDKDTASGSNDQRFAFVAYNDAPSFFGGTVQVGTLAQGIAPQAGYGLYQHIGHAWFSNRVGIGVAPDFALDVNLSAQIRQTLRVNGATGLGGAADVTVGLRSYFKSRFDAPVGIGVVPNDTYALTINGSEYLSGLLGVGVEPNSSFVLTVGGPATFTSTVSIASTVEMFGGLNVAGAVAAGSLTSVLATSVGGNLTVNGVQGIGVVPNPAYSLLTAGPIGVGTALDVGGPTGLAGALNVNGKISAFSDIELSGNLGINTGTMTHDISVNGTAAKTGGGPWDNFTSARALKQDIAHLGNALQTLLQLQGRTWRWADDRPDLEAILPGKQVGFVMDEVAAAMPAWVRTAHDGSQSYAEHGFPAYVVEALRELTGRLRALEARA